MTYDELVATLKTMCEVPQNNSDENFIRILPAMFLYADGRIYKELMFQQVTITQPGTLVARNRELALPTSVMSLRGINLCTPPQAISTTTKRTPLERVPPDILDAFWPQSSFRPGPPVKYALVGASVTQDKPQVLGITVRFMPTPDAAYPVEFLGDIRPLPPSNKNPETFLTVYYPELYICACMIFAAGYQRDFGAQADDPQRAASWESQYQLVKGGATLEAARMRGEGPGFTGATPTPLAVPRGGINAAG